MKQGLAVLTLLAVVIALIVGGNQYDQRVDNLREVLRREHLCADACFPIVHQKINGTCYCADPSGNGDWIKKENWLGGKTTRQGSGSGLYSRE